jgi:hypothetical protein
MRKASACTIHSHWQPFEDHMDLMLGVEKALSLTVCRVGRRLIPPLKRTSCLGLSEVSTRVWRFTDVQGVTNFARRISLASRVVVASHGLADSATPRTIQRTVVEVERPLPLAQHFAVMFCQVAASVHQVRRPFALRFRCVLCCVAEGCAELHGRSFFFVRVEPLTKSC